MIKKVVLCFVVSTILAGFGFFLLRTAWHIGENFWYGYAVWYILFVILMFFVFLAPKYDSNDT